MTNFRYIPLSVHAGLETLVAFGVMVAPFAFGFGQAATVISVAIGVVLLGLAIQLPGPARSVSLAQHASFDYALATFAVVSGLAIGIAIGTWAPAAFLVGIGAAMVALTASTRFTAPPGV